MSSGFLRLETTGAVARLTLDRPERGHAWLRGMWAEAAGLVEGLATRDDVLALILDSTGETVFSGGADLDDLRDAQRDPELLRALADDAQRFLNALERAPQVTIAAMTGSALGAGLLIAAACDVRVLSDEARVGVPAAKLGVVLGRADVARLVRIAGPALAHELVLTARILDAREALAGGLVSRLERPHRVRDAADALAAGVARLSGPSVREMKQHLLAVSPGWQDLPA